METIHALSSKSLQYYFIAKHWASDLEFFEIEIGFLHRLLDDYFIRISDQKHLNELKKVGKELLILEQGRSRTAKLLGEQLKELELMAEDVVPEDIDELSVKQIQLEYLIHSIVSEYRNVKKQMFGLVESVMKDNRPTKA